MSFPSFRLHRGLLAGLLAIGGLAVSVDALARDAGPQRDGPQRDRTAPHWQKSAGFKAIDTDGDGKLSEAEIRAFAASRTAEIDTNKDGVISPEEMQAHHERQREKMRQARLTRLDDNKDGVISAEEYQRHLADGMLRHGKERDGSHRKGPPHRHRTDAPAPPK